jgi:penicillin-binding protein 1A
MVDAGVITAEQRAQAAASPVRVSRTLSSQHAQYFIDWLDKQIRELVGEPTEDMIVETTMDLTCQTQAERSVNRILTATAQGRAAGGAGGAGRRGPGPRHDRRRLLCRQPVQPRRRRPPSGRLGLQALRLSDGAGGGYTPQTRVNDAPIRIGNWSPRNYSGTFAGEMPCRNAVAQSVNTVAAGLADQIGRDNVARTARRLGITSRIGLEPAMALGAVEVSPIEMAQAYDAFANGGKRVRAYGISRIRTPQGRVIYQRSARADGGGAGDQPTRSSTIRTRCCAAS